MLFIVAMSVEGHLIGQSIICMISVDVIDLNQVLVPKSQFTPCAFSLLPLEQTG